MTGATDPGDPAAATGHPQSNPRVDRDARSAFSVAGDAMLVRWRLDGPPLPQVVVVRGS